MHDSISFMGKAQENQHDQHHRSPSIAHNSKTPKPQQQQQHSSDTLTLMLPSALPEAMQVPSGWNSTVLMAAPWPS
jgi:hypothetical protein